VRQKRTQFVGETLCQCAGKFKHDNINKIREKAVDNKYGSSMGQMTTGGGVSHLSESLAAMNVPSMDTKLHAQMLEVEKEERELAMEHGDFHQGVPAIAVLNRSGWGKHSYEHSYSAKSTVGVKL